MANQIDILIKAKNETDAAFSGVWSNLQKTGLSAAAAGAAIVGLGAAVAAAVKDFASFGSQLSDQSAKLGVGVEALQKWQKAGELVGVSASDISSAMTQMQRRLVESPEAFTKLGLSVSTLIKMKPDEAFAEVAKALQKIPDPARQTAAAMDALGRGGATVLPLIKSGFEDAANEAENLGQIMSAETVAAADALDDQITVLNSTWEGLLHNLTAIIATNPQLLGTLRDLTDVLGAVSKFTQDNSESLGTVTVAIVKFQQAIAPVIPLLKEFAKLQEGVAPQIKTGGISFEPATIEAMDFAKANQLLTEQLRETKQEISNQAAKARDLAKAHADAKREAAELTKHNKEYAEAQEQLVPVLAMVLGLTVNQTEALLGQRGAIDATWLSTEQWTQRVTDLQNAYSQMLDEMVPAMAMTTGLSEDAIRLAMGQQVATDGVIKKNQDWAQTLQNLSNGFNLLGGTAGKTLSQIAGGIASVMTNIKTIQAANKEGGIAGLLGKITGGLGIAGTVIGVGKGIFDALFGGAKKAREEMEKLKASFLQSQGGMQALAAKAREAGVSLDAMFKAKNATQLQSAITAITNQLDGWTESQEKLQAAMDKYGLTVDQMGPKFAQQQLDKQAADLLQSYNLLTAAGAQNDLVLQKMSEDMNGYIQTSLKAGTAVPEAMRPMIERMIQMGLLTDDAGNAFTSVEDAGIKFTETLTEGLSRAIDAINRLVAALTQGINVPAINIPVNGGGTAPVHTTPGGHYGGGFPEFAGGGYVSVPTPILAGEAGPEFIFPEEKLSKMLAAAAAAGAAANGGNSGPTGGVVMLDGRPMGKWVANTTRRRSTRIHPHGVSLGRSV